METIYVTKEDQHTRLTHEPRAKSLALSYHAHTSSPRYVLVVPVKIWAVHFWRLSPALENHWTHWDAGKAMCTVVGAQDEPRVRQMVIPGGMQWIPLSTHEPPAPPPSPAASSSYLTCQIQ